MTPRSSHKNGIKVFVSFPQPKMNAFSPSRRDVLSPSLLPKQQSKLVLPMPCKHLFGLLSLFLGLNDSMTLRRVSKDHMCLLSTPLDLYLDAYKPKRPQTSFDVYSLLAKRLEKSLRSQAPAVQADSFTTTTTNATCLVTSSKTLPFSQLDRRYSEYAPASSLSPSHTSKEERKQNPDVKEFLALFHMRNQIRQEVRLVVQSFKMNWRCVWCCIAFSGVSTTIFTS